MASAYTTQCRRDEQESSDTYSSSIINFIRVIHDYAGKLAKKRDCLNSLGATSSWKDMTLTEKDDYQIIFLTT